MLDLEYGRLTLVKNEDLNNIHASRFNRETDPKQVSTLVKSMKEKGYNKVQPISVDPNYNVIDGTHRLEAAIESGVDAWVIRYNEEATSELIRQVNSDTKKWDNYDCITALSRGGSLTHQQLKLLFDTYVTGEKFCVQTLMFACTGRVSIGSLTEAIKDDFKFAYPYKTIAMRLAALKEVRDVCPRCDVNLEKALLLCVSCKQISNKMLCKKIGDQPDKIKKFTSVRSALVALQEIYNFRARVDNRLDFLHLTGMDK